MSPKQPCPLIVELHSKGSLFSQEVAPRLLYTHHQKTVVVDDPNMHQMVAFVGGLDLTQVSLSHPQRYFASWLSNLSMHINPQSKFNLQGRFDSPEFPIFKTLRSFHKGDFRNKCYPGVTEESGPREPWHDIHSQV